MPLDRLIKTGERRRMKNRKIPLIHKFSIFVMKKKKKKNKMRSSTFPAAKLIISYELLPCRRRSAYFNDRGESILWCTARLSADAIESFQFHGACRATNWTFILIFFWNAEFVRYKLRHQLGAGCHDCITFSQWKTCKFLPFHHLHQNFQIHLINYLK